MCPRTGVDRGGRFTPQRSRSTTNVREWPVVESSDVVVELLDADGGTLHRELAFADFAEAWRFMSAVAEVAEAHDHHPDWSNAWNRVVIDLVSHDAGAITARDHRMAAAIDAILVSYAP